jgi:hypothetical protein
VLFLYLLQAVGRAGQTRLTCRYEVEDADGLSAMKTFIRMGIH